MARGPLVGLSQGAWTDLSVTVPAGVSVMLVGVQLLVTPFAATATVYVDSVRWT